MSPSSSENPYRTPQSPPYRPPFHSSRYCTQAIVALVCSFVGLVVCGIVAAWVHDALATPVCWYVGLFLCGIVLEPTALSLSIVGLKKTREDPNLKGRAMATAGVVISVIVLVLSILVLLSIFWYDGSFRWRS
jgi:drug/metabolite transporter superfamily protein YnfA